MPQLAWSVAVLVQAEPQRVWPVAQLETAVAQTPAAQYSSAAQAVPQPPQWAGSFFGSTHFPPQALSFALQLTAQTPLLHCSPAAQAFPQTPQLRTSTSSETHSLPQVVQGTGGSPAQEERSATASTMGVNRPSIPGSYFKAQAFSGETTPGSYWVWGGDP